MPYRDDLVEDVLLSLAGYLTDQELIGTLNATTTTGATTFTVDGSVFADGSGFQPGLAEIGNELIYVGAVNPSTGVFSSVIRGFRGTTAAAWAGGTVVRANPRVPRTKVVRALNDTLDEVYPRLYSVVETDITSVSGQAAYDIPATAADVLDVSLQHPDLVSAWRKSRYWSFVANAGSESTTGKQVFVEDLWEGAEIHVTYAVPPAQFSEASATNQDMVTQTGLPVWCREVLVLGAAYKIMSFMDAGHIASRTAEGDLIALQSPIGTAEKLSKHLFALYQERLTRAEERLRSASDVGSVHYKLR